MSLTRLLLRSGRRCGMSHDRSYDRSTCIYMYLVLRNWDQCLLEAEEI